MAAFTALAIGLLVAGAVTDAVGKKKAGDAAKAAGLAQQDAANDQADVADYNASVADLQATDAIDRGQQEADRYRTQVKGLIGSERAGYAAGNVDVGYGSAVDVQADTAHLGELDALTIKTNAGREAWGYQVQATDLRRSADIARKTGVFDAQAGAARQTADNFAAAGTLLGAGGSLLSSKYGFGK